MKSTVVLFVLVLAILIFPGFSIKSSDGFIHGNGNVITQERPASTFTSVAVSSGIDVYLIPGNTEKIEVEADENIQNLIITEVKDGVLNIYSEKHINNAKKMNVYLTFKQLTEIRANGGSDVYTKNPLNLNSLSVMMNGGSDINLDGAFKTLTIDLNGGSDAVLTGSGGKVTFNANGGSDLKASGFPVDECSIVAVGGSDAWVNVKNTLNVQAVGGSDVYYSGDPKKVQSEVRGGSDLIKKP